MARSLRTRSRASTRGAKAQTSAVAFWRWKHAADAAGVALLLVSLGTTLALFRAEGAVAEPLGQVLYRTMGRLAILAPIWGAGAGILVISHRVNPRPWPWLRLGAAVVASLCLLGIAALEAQRRGVPSADGQGGGIVGRLLTNVLSDWFGVLSTALFMLALLGVSGFVASGLSTEDVRRGGRWALALAKRGVARLRARAERPALRINAAQATRPPSEDEEGHQPRSKRAAPAQPVVVQAPPEPPAGAREWRLPPINLFQARKAKERPVGELREQARIIEETLSSFGIAAHVVEANQGPVVTQFGVEPGLGVPVTRITARLNDLALRLGSSPIRIEAPVPGRKIVGIEVPNTTISVVALREILESPAFDRSKARIPLALGKDTSGTAQVGDLARMPHLLIAGATGAGKSVCVNSIVACLLTQFSPDELQLVMIDPKMVELIAYNGIPHLRMPVVTEMDRVVGTLRWAIREMERRYKLFADRGVRNIDGFNQSVESRPDERPLPYLILIIDELADLMMTAPEDAEKTICRLAQLARATGIHLIVSTQRPSVDVITGLIKANFPSRIAFAVTSQVDSRVILDSVGAERLLGRGDMLYLPPDAGKAARLQGVYVSDEEIEALVSHWKALGTPQYDESDLAEVESLAKPPEPEGDDLFDRAVDLAEESRRLSVSLLQRRLGIGYPRAARLMDTLEEQGIVEASEDRRSWRVLTERD